MNNLRQLDGAKQEWLLDKKPPTNAWPSKADMMHYLGPPGAIDFNQCVPPSDGEIYIVNRADRPVAVYLTKDYSVFKEGQLLTIDDIQPPYNP